MVKQMPIEEFVGLGYLQELNRCFLHPLGLALQVTREGDKLTLSGVWDNRDDPEGIIFATAPVGPGFEPEDVEKAERIQGNWLRRTAPRLQALGYLVQPVADLPVSGCSAYLCGGPPFLPSKRKE